MSNYHGDLPLGEVIYSAVKPIIKIYIIIAVGFYLSRKNILTVETTRSISTISIRVLMPCLAFQKIVTNINNRLIHEVSTIVIIAFFMMFSQAIVIFMIGATLGCPRNWWGGLILCGLLPNISDLPIAYLQTMETANIFENVDLGVSFVMIYLGLQLMLQFTMGSYKLVERDFNMDLQVEANEDIALEEGNKSSEASSSNSSISSSKKGTLSDDEDNQLETENKEAEIAGAVASDDKSESVVAQPNNSFKKCWKMVTHFFLAIDWKAGFWNMVAVWKDSFRQPASIMVIVSITVAMIPWLQALFVESPQVHLPDAPDKQPPLSFLMDFAGYIGAAQVPFGLLLLGGTIGRLKFDGLPKSLWRVPIAVTLLRLFFFPVVGCALNSKMHKDGLFYGQDILYFLSNINFCLPPATSLLYLTSFYLPDDGKDHIQMDLLALTYICHYILLVFCLPFTATYTMKVSLGF